MIEMNTYNIVLSWSLLSLITSLVLMWAENKEGKKDLLAWLPGGWLLWVALSLFWPLGIACTIIMIYTFYYKTFKIGLLRKRKLNSTLKNTLKITGGILGGLLLTFTGIYCTVGIMIIIHRLL